MKKKPWSIIHDCQDLRISHRGSELKVESKGERIIINCTSTTAVDFIVKFSNCPEDE